jgi:hypothetical protein
MLTIELVLVFALKKEDPIFGDFPLHSLAIGKEYKQGSPHCVSCPVQMLHQVK